jgi:hypothetical protein
VWSHILGEAAFHLGANNEYGFLGLVVTTENTPVKYRQQIGRKYKHNYDVFVSTNIAIR